MSGRLVELLYTFLLSYFHIYSVCEAPPSVSRSKSLFPLGVFMTKDRLGTPTYALHNAQSNGQQSSSRTNLSKFVISFRLCILFLLRVTTDQATVRQN